MWLWAPFGWRSTNVGDWGSCGVLAVRGGTTFARNSAVPVHITHAGYSKNRAVVLHLGFHDSVCW